MCTAEPLRAPQVRSWPTWALLALLWLAFAYFWLLPVVKPRGYYLWGHFKISDIFIGIPLGLATLCATVVALTPQRLRRVVALRLVTLCVAILATVAVFDIVYTFGFLKIWHPNMYLDNGASSRKYGLADSELGFIRKPNLSWFGQATRDTQRVEFRTDENGFRNPPGLRRGDILFIGDSYTDAPQVAENETFAHLVGEATGQSVINLGMGAYGPPQELGVLQRYGLSYQPRIVVWTIFEGNDLGDTQTYVQWKMNPNKNYVSLLGRYVENSFIHQIFRRTMAERPEPGSAPAKLRFTDGTSRNVYIKYPYEFDQPEKKAAGMSEIQKNIETGFGLCQERGARLVVVFIPTMVRVMAPYITFERKSDHDRFLRNDIVQDDKDFLNRVRKVCAQLGCPFVDGFMPLRQAALADNRNLFIPDDEHLNVRGHTIIASEIVKSLNAAAPSTTSK